MKENLFSETLLNWQRFSREDKIKHLQMLENMNSKLQNRRAREVVARDFSEIPAIAEFVNMGGGPIGMYDILMPDYLYVNSQQLDSIKNRPIDFIDTIHHEGYHGLIHDFTKGHDLPTISEVSRESLIRHRIAQNIFYASDFIKLDMYIQNEEERVVVRETALNIIANLFDICENETDCLRLIDSYLQIFCNLIAWKEEEGQV